MQSPASSIQSPRPQGWPQAQQPGAFEKELMASLHVLLNQLGEVERQGLVMFHKIEESFKHPYTQQEAIADTANLLIQLDTLTTQAKTTGYGALTTLPTSQTVVSTPSASSNQQPGTTLPGGSTPKPMFLSPRMQNHIHNNHHTTSTSTTTTNSTGNNSNNFNGNNTPGLADTQMMSPTPVSLVGTPSAQQVNPLSGILPTSTTTGPPTPSGIPGVGSPSAFPTSDVLMAASTPIADPNAAAGGVTGGAGTPATPSAAWSANPSAALGQMLDARQKDVQALSTEKRKLKTNFKVAAQMIKI
ncbi:hypothetical protein BGX29_011482 [Mortierella sp. GBA35]|nr:hypothetical protein BGX29_011482 [Mortierella sp. GBA35]KAG0215309.1 hypothetical protein BGX33_001264 [Mortierella sp. NVP41]